MKTLSLISLLFCLQYVAGKTRFYYLQPTAGVTKYSVVKASVKNIRQFIEKKEDDITVKSLYSQDINETGWAYIEIHTNDAYQDDVQAYSAGYIEGYLTSQLIYMHWYNTLGGYCDGENRRLCAYLDNFLEQNFNFINSNTKDAEIDDPYWYQVKLFYKQLEGLVDGYNHANNDTSKTLSYKDLLWLNMQGDFEDLEQVFASKTGILKENGKVLGQGHCSALVKVLPGGEELFVAQDTWSTYQSMLRIQKKYKTPYQKSASMKDRIPGEAMTFSSYPGVITSGDDFYVISSGLVTLETTIGNSNSSLWKYVTPNGTVLEGIRSTVANRLADSGKTWTEFFTTYNSGTYNNQWMVVDYKKFKRGTSISQLQDGLLWVLEQIPGVILAEDMTEVLRRQSYWPSYNVAAFPLIFQLSGNQVMVDKYGDWFTYDKNPRALIFKRDHNKVRDLKTMLELMRYNDFKNDPLSRCDCTPPYSAENAIAARCDLNPANGTYPFGALGHRSHGATDAKITSSELFHKGLQFLGISSPIYNKERGIPPFQWSTSDYNKQSHLGHPDLWQFQPVIHRWG